MKSAHPIDRRVPRARKLRVMSTPAEQRLWRALRKSPMQGFHFRRQATIGPYFVDLCCHAARLIVEIDGADHADARRRMADEARTRFLEARGYLVLRFWNNEVFESTNAIAETVLATTRKRLSSSQKNPPPLTPPHRKRGEGKRGSGAPSVTPDA